MEEGDQVSVERETILHCLGVIILTPGKHFKLSEALSVYTAKAQLVGTCPCIFKKNSLKLRLKSFSLKLVSA